jgi:hypothetical protein
LLSGLLVALLAALSRILLLLPGFPILVTLLLLAALLAATAARAAVPCRLA